MGTSRMDHVIAAHAAMRARIEAVPFAPSLGAFVDDAAARHGPAQLWRFIEMADEVPLRELSYARLAQATRRIAGGLAARGVKHGERVGVMLPNIPAFPLTWLALARLGAVMLPVNTGYTVRELDYVLADGGAAHLVVHEEALPVLLDLLSQRSLLDPSCIHVVGRPPAGMQAWERLLAADPIAEQGDGPGLEDLVNLQYTSGTTGFPKGCMLTHRYWLTLGRVAARAAAMCACCSQPSPSTTWTRNGCC
jgi:acyl-CoA synthetase (AMP-forming)/AMP-acid ligase II